jgi:parallel beta-helix repeat protein
MKTASSASLIVIMIGGLLLVNMLRIGAAQTSTEVIGIISSDTRWTKVNSPYILTGPVKVNNSVTLTIEAGATVNLNSYYIQVEGTLEARGSSADQIHFNSGSIKFTDSSNDWNEQTGTGCIIENAMLNSVEISSKNAIKLNHNTINGDVTVNGASIVLSNTIVGTVDAEGSTEVRGNTITGGISAGGLYATSEKYPKISSNSIFGGFGYEKCGISSSGYALIVDNTISDCNFGVKLFTGSYILGGSYASNAIIERNKITGTTHGIHLEIYTTRVHGSIKPFISSNTISQNTIGVYLDGDAHYLTIKNNNIQDNSGYSLYLSSAQDLNATYNWWGTTDAQSIKQKIFDFDRDFNLGKVTFVPFLTEPKAQAMPDSNAPIPNLTPTPPTTELPSTSPMPSQEPQQIEIIAGAVIVAIVLGAGLGFLIYFIRRQ